MYRTESLQHLKVTDNSSSVHIFPPFFFFQISSHSLHVPTINLSSKRNGAGTEIWMQGFVNFLEIQCAGAEYFYKFLKRICSSSKFVMAGEFQESITPSFSGNGSNENGEFECNICFEVAQDPIVTLCGHLYCWPCLYMWLHNHSKCKECPVCKALVKEEKLVPIYGRGKKSSYPGPWLMPGADLDIPNRPTGQRPETAPAPPPDASYFRQDDFGSPGGFSFLPMASTRFGNFTFSAAFGGLIQSLSLHVSGFHDATVYGAIRGFPYWFSSSFHGGHVHGFHLRSNQEQQKTSLLKMSFFVFGFALIVALLLF